MKIEDFLQVTSLIMEFNVNLCESLISCVKISPEFKINLKERIIYSFSKAK